MTITGNLETMELSELLQWLSQGRKTGTLAVTNGHVEKRIVFREGHIISSSSTDPKDQLGHFLVSYGYITEQELIQAMEMQEGNKMFLGKILSTIGAVPEADLNRLLRLTAQETIYDLFSWTEGEFRFLDGELPESTMLPMELDVTKLVLKGIQRLDEWKWIREVLPSLQAVPVMVDPPEDSELDDLSRRVLAQVNDDRTVEEICLELHSTEFQVCKVLAEHVRAKRIKMVRPRGATWSQDMRETTATVDPQALLGKARAHFRAGELDRSARYLRAARSLDPEGRQLKDEPDELEALIRKAVGKAGVGPAAIPRVTVSQERMTELDLSPQEGFILSRLDGSYSVAALTKISPMPELETLITLWKLASAGHIELVAEG